MSLAIDDCRRYPRTAVSLRTRLAAAGETRWVRCANVSRGGIFVRTRWLLPEGAIVDLDIAGTLAIGRVVRIGARPAGMGIEFADVAADDLESLGCPPVDRRAAPSRPLEIVFAGRGEIAAFRAHGHRVRAARSAEQAVLLAFERRPSLLICEPALAADVLPFVRGRVPTLCLSDDRAERLRCLRLGADAVAESASAALCAELAPKPARTLRGAISQVPLARVLALLEHDRQSGILLIAGNRFEFRPMPLSTGSPQ
jgi:hypothetical protein